MSVARMVGRRAAAALGHGGAQKVAFALGHTSPQKLVAACGPACRGFFSTRQCSKDDSSGGVSPGDVPPGDDPPKEDQPSGGPAGTGVVLDGGSKTGGAPSIGSISGGQTNALIPYVPPASNFVLCGDICPCGCGPCFYFRTGVIPTSTGVPAGGDSSTSASSGGQTNAVVLRGGAPRCSAPCCPLPCCISLGRGVPSGLQVVQDFRTRELKLAKVAREQGEERIRQNLVKIDQAVTSDNLKLWDAALQLKQKEELKKAEEKKTRALQQEKEDIKTAEIQSRVAEGLRKWEKDLAKTSEDLDAREAAAKEQHQVGLVLEIHGVKIKSSDVTVKESEYARLREVMKVQESDIDRSSAGKNESNSKSEDESGTTGGKKQKQSWSKWYKNLWPDVKFAINLALFLLWDSCIRNSLAYIPESGPGSTSKGFKACRAAIEVYVEWISKEQRELLNNVRERIASMEKEERIASMEEEERIASMEKEERIASMEKEEASKSED